MISLFLPLFLCVSASLAGSYAPPPVVEPSPSVYGSPYSTQVNTYGYPQQTVEDTIYKEPLVAEVPFPIPTIPQPQTYQYPIQVTTSQSVYEYPSTVFSDHDTTTTYPTTTTTYAPATEVSEDEEQYGVPEIPSPLPFNPLSSVLPAQESPVVSQPAQTQSYAPPPLVQAAPFAYGAPVPSPASSSSYGSPSSYDQLQYNELQYSAGEVPLSVAVPGTPKILATDAFPPRVLHRKKIRAQKRFHKKL